MNHSEFLNLLVRGRDEDWGLDEGYQVDLKANASAYPFLDLDGVAVRPATATVYHMEKIERGTAKIHTVVLAYAEGDFYCYCGDSYLEGRMRKRGLSPDDRRRKAASAVHATNSENADVVMASLFGIAEENTGCNFWSRWRSGQCLCKHTHTVLRQLERNGELEMRLDTLVQTYDTLMRGEATSASLGWLDETALVDRLAFRRPTLFEGDRGSGKTVTVRSYAKKHGLPLVPVDGNEGLEATDLLGMFVPSGANGFVWKDGRLSEAFRLAQKGKVVLLIDELLRIPVRQLSVLLSALSPFDGKYGVNTGRIIDGTAGIGREERLECPIENLCVFATTNIGGKFAVDRPDPALIERFMILRKDTTASNVEERSGEDLTQKGYDPRIALKLKNFFIKMQQLVQQGMAEEAPTLRTICGAIALADNQQEIPRWLEQSALLWVGRDITGSPVVEQLEAVRKLIAKEFA